MEKDDKLRALDAALGQIEKQFGKGAVMRLGDPAAQMNIETIPTGSLSHVIPAQGKAGFREHVIPVVGGATAGIYAFEAVM